ncbi:MAG TPA: hypothetical protein VLH83_06645 [Chthoniobacterales bacterium]|nr:hypothetical protein [Chthoniobacterales bacterium]
MKKTFPFPAWDGIAKALCGLALISCGLSWAAAQDAAPLELSFGPTPPKNAAQKNDEATVAVARRHGVADLRVRYVKIEARWAGQIKLPLAPGDRLTNEKLSQSLNALRAAITAPSNLDLGLKSKGEVGVLYIYVDYDTSAADGTVGVIFRPYYVDIALVEIGKNVLPIPRSPWATFYQNVPEALRAFNPTVGLSYDRQFGSAITASFGGDPLSLFSKSDSLGVTRQMDLHGDGAKSLENDFYRASGGVSFAIQETNSFLEELTFSADFDGTREPLGTGEHSREAGIAALGLKTKVGPNTRLYLSAGYRHSSDRLLDGDTAIETNTSTDGQTGRLLFDTIPPGIEGFLRGAIWEEAAWLNGDAYQRVVLRVGYEKEIPIAPNQTVGVEIIAGGGKTFGDVPAYARFFGGNAPGQFLYDNATSTGLMTMPSGPIIRSLGENEAHLRNGRNTFGGETFWHVNINATIPIPPWSMPLIPNVATDIPDIDGNPLTIKTLMRRQIDVTGPSMLAAVLQEQGMSAQEANHRAKQILQEVAPATHFIIDEANLFSIKPLLMFDAAGLSGSHGEDETWLAAGGGIQLTIVTAKFEAGYMHTLSGPTFGDRGNAFVRLMFQNLF